MNVILLLLFVLLSSAMARPVTLDAQENLNRLLLLDKNKDKKITMDDGLDEKNSFSLKLSDGKSLEVKGVYYLGNLLQELKLATEDQVSPDVLQTEIIFENPVDRISRLIRTMFWDGLTRKIEGKTLSQVLPDSKIDSEVNYLYVPEKDTEAISYFQQATKDQKNIQVKIVPQKIDQGFLNSLKGKHGLLSLKLGEPYVVPGGRFNEMYGWDSYFEALGLIQDKRVDLARSMVNNFVYEITHYGKILNANRTYYLGRSQPPFLTSMIREVYEATPKKGRSNQWLADALRAAIKEYETVWMGTDRLTSTGLSRYYGTSKEVPPEVEDGHFDKIFASYAKKHQLSIRDFEKKYKEGLIKEPELDNFFIHDQAVRESGHDTTYRWMKNGKDACADFVTIDLNSLLYKTELDIAFLIKKEFKDNFEGHTSAAYLKKASARKKIMRELLWDPKGYFFDYDVKEKRRSTYLSATAFYPLWAYESSDESTRILEQKEAKLLITNLLRELEAPGGILSGSKKSLEKLGGKPGERQWDYPHGWAPHQMMTWKGLRNYGFTHHADRLTYKWLYMVTRNAMDYNGTIPEKYDVVKQSHKVFSEYGNVGTKFSYITREGFGWMNASYQVGLSSLGLTYKKKLKSLIPPPK